MLLQLAVSTAARGRTTVLLDTEGKVCANRIKEIVTRHGQLFLASKAGGGGKSAKDIMELMPFQKLVIYCA